MTDINIDLTDIGHRLFLPSRVTLIETNGALPGYLIPYTMTLLDGLQQKTSPMTTFLESGKFYPPCIDLLEPAHTNHLAGKTRAILKESSLRLATCTLTSTASREACTLST